MFPPFPGDTIIAFGAYLAGRGFLWWLPVYLWTVAGNFGSQLLIYYLGRSRGREFIKKHPRLFHPELLPRVALLYRRWGMRLIFFSRFLVGMRSIVPLFAGISRFKPRRFLIPITVSILVQHGVIIYLGHLVGRNWEEIKKILEEINLGLGVVAVVFVLLLVFWFRKISRHSKKRLERRMNNNKGDLL
jgi:membrane protein DedA with SNARE-associated domain